MLWGQHAKYFLSQNFFLILTSSVEYRNYQVSFNWSPIYVYPIRTGVLQGLILSHILYSIYNSDIPEHFPQSAHLLQIINPFLLISPHYYTNPKPPGPSWNLVEVMKNKFIPRSYSCLQRIVYIVTYYTCFYYSFKEVKENRFSMFHTDLKNC